ncbi:MAG: DUF2934 domain-containing protein [Planctomycetes bacterium]|nr:DUF2934 domain-containing protein [Planctomycetota bacterium]
MSWLRRLRNRNAPATVPSPAPAPAAPVSTAVPPPVAALPPIDIPHDKIEARAYEIWVRKGKPHGLDLENWTEAEAELRAEFAARPNPEPLPRKPR